MDTYCQISPLEEALKEVLEKLDSEKSLDERVFYYTKLALNKLPDVSSHDLVIFGRKF